MAKLGLIGHGVGRSQASKLHCLLGEMSGVTVTYDLFDAAQDGALDLAAQLDWCAEQGFAGVNVTHPFKQDAHGLTVPSATLPAGLTSVNTVVFSDDRRLSFNTDYSGCVRALIGNVASGGRVLLMGAGGVGIAIGYAVAQLQPAEIVIADREADRAVALADGLGAAGIPARIAGDDTVVEARAADGLINATPLGMYQYPGCAYPAEAIGGQRWAFDAVYTPRETVFTGLARDGGLEVIPGFELFFFQALDAFEKFTGTAVPADDVRRAYAERYRVAS